jgi:hypothetical protein
MLCEAAARSVRLEVRLLNGFQRGGWLGAPGRLLSTHFLKSAVHHSDERILQAYADLTVEKLKPSCWNSRMVEESREALLAKVASASDNDGLVGGVLDEVEQEWVRIGGYWIGLDPRIPWQLSQCFRQHRALLQHLRVRLYTANIETSGEHRSPLRKAFWWGAQFKWSEIDKYRGELKTVHADPLDPIQGLDFVAKATFKWNFPADQPIAVLQIEEFRDTPETPAATFTSRYLHSVLNLTEKTFTHLDGAIKTYSPELYLRAYDGNDIKAEGYEKLFRTDAPVEMDDRAWLDHVASFFPGDHLVREYFGGA